MLTLCSPGSQIVSGEKGVQLTDADTIQDEVAIVHPIVAKLWSNVSHTHAWKRQMCVQVPDLHHKGVQPMILQRTRFPPLLTDHPDLLQCGCQVSNLTSSGRNRYAAAKASGPKQMGKHITSDFIGRTQQAASPGCQ